MQADLYVLTTIARVRITVKFAPNSKIPADSGGRNVNDSNFVVASFFYDKPNVFPAQITIKTTQSDRKNMFLQFCGFNFAANHIGRHASFFILSVPRSSVLDSV